MHPQLPAPMLLMFWASFQKEVLALPDLTNFQPVGYLMCVRHCLNTGGCACIMYKISETHCIVHTRSDQCKNSTEISRFSNTSHCGERVCSKREVCLKTNQGDDRCVERYSPRDAADESRTTGESISPEHKVQDKFHQHLNVAYSCGHAELLYTKFKFDASSVNPDCSVDPEGRLFSHKMKNGTKMKGKKLRNIYGAFSNMPVWSKSGYTVFTVVFNFQKKLKYMKNYFNFEIGLCRYKARLYKVKSVTSCPRCLGFKLEKSFTKLVFYHKNFRGVAEILEIFPYNLLWERDYLSFTFLFDKKAWHVYSHEVDAVLASFERVKCTCRKFWPIVSIHSIEDVPVTAESVPSSQSMLKAMFQNFNCG